MTTCQGRRKNGSPCTARALASGYCFAHDPALAQKRDAAYAHLCLTPDAPPELVKAVHHWWVRALHPDTGHGDTARMASINAAVDVIKEESERKAS